MIDAHVHIERGNYNIDWINEFINFAISRGLSEVWFLEHSHRFQEFKTVYEDVSKYNEYQSSLFDSRLKLSLNDYKNFIRQMKETQFPLTVKFGLETCFIEGKESAIKDILSDFDWDFVTGSVHWIDGFGFDHKKEFWDGRDTNKLYKRYYEIMKGLIASGLFNVLAHPDSIKCFRFYPDYDLTETYLKIADLLNINNMFCEQSAGLYLNYKFDKLGMNEKMFEVFKTKKVRLITASDAHRPEDTGKYIDELPTY